LKILQKQTAVNHALLVWLSITATPSVCGMLNGTSLTYGNASYRNKA